MHRTQCIECSLPQVCQNSCADGSVQAVELYVQLSPNFSMSDLRVLIGTNHVEITEKVPSQTAAAMYDRHWQSSVSVPPCLALS